MFYVFLFTDPATTEFYTLSLHDALPIYVRAVLAAAPRGALSSGARGRCDQDRPGPPPRRYPGDVLPQPLLRRQRSEEHTSELQSHSDLVCRLLLEKKKKKLNVHQQYLIE